MLPVLLACSWTGSLSKGNFLIEGADFEGRRNLVAHENWVGSTGCLSGSNLVALDPLGFERLVPATLLSRFDVTRS